ncbi:aminoacyl-tRNA hydrolase [bacterium]|nr:aminoacyl-tRNA hydrolase [bacterium]
MKLIFGLGNPGEDYNKTRHNLGAQVVSEISRQLAVKLSHTSRGAEWGRGSWKNTAFVLARSRMFMNLSGRSVAALANYFRIPPENLLIVVDDLNPPLGSLRFRARGSAGGHNGLKSIIEIIDSQDFNRLRLGINQPPVGVRAENFVLQPFRKEERLAVDNLVEKAVPGVLHWMDNGIESVMTEYN